MGDLVAAAQLKFTEVLLDAQDLARSPGAKTPERVAEAIGRSVNSSIKSY
jgi:hypothetical protein